MKGIYYYMYKRLINFYFGFFSNDMQINSILKNNRKILDKF